MVVRDGDRSSSGCRGGDDAEAVGDNGNNLKMMIIL